MSFAAKANFNFNQSATWTIGPFQLLDSTGLAVPISACAGKIRKNIIDTVPAAVFNCSVIDATNGIAQAVLSATTTAALVANISKSGERDFTQYFYDINVTLADNVTVLDILFGVIIMAPTVNY